ncbi:hypothetical protein [Amycolatopsis sp. NPDC058986]|uniref:hypothetical protein n=1 Tax=Actinomycetes TaxID=1760 RepID=UPI00366AF795
MTSMFRIVIHNAISQGPHAWIIADFAHPLGALRCARTNRYRFNNTRLVIRQTSNDVTVTLTLNDLADIVDALPQHAPVHLEKARQLITDGGIVLLRNGRNPVFVVVSSGGDTRYLTAVQACTCPAGRYDRTCYHRIAAELLTTATA